MSSLQTAVHPSGSRRPVSRRPVRRRPRGRRARRRTAGSARRSGPRNKGNWWSLLMVAAAVLAAVAWSPEPAVPPADGPCTLPLSGIVLTTEQLSNAGIIAEVGRARGLPDRAIVIALATAQQESRLRNLDYGDRDSLGLFQQRPSQGWGTEQQVRDPVYAAGIFYDRLVQVSGWESGRLTEVAQAVQRSGHPDLYQQWEVMAQELAVPVRTGDFRALGCS